MIERMRSGEGPDAETGRLHPKQRDLIQCVLLVDRSDRLMQISKGVPEKLHNFRFALDRVGAILAAHIDRWFLIQDGRPEDVVDRGHVFYLLGKSTDALKLTGGGSKRILIFGHGISGTDELARTYIENRIDGIALSFSRRHGHLAKRGH